uniref:MAD2L1 binding protein n=1 Tax=Callorhinchus milii TaxID=7868 RepID=A0A4W3JGK6_CALMI
MNPTCSYNPQFSDQVWGRDALLTPRLDKREDKTNAGNKSNDLVPASARRQHVGAETGRGRDRDGERSGAESGDTAKVQEGNEEPERESNGLECREAAEPVCPGKRSEAEVSVLFAGPVSRDGCCRLVCEIVKHVLYQRQQMPLPYEQLPFFTRRANEPEDYRRNEQSDRKKYQRALSDLDEVFQNLEAVFGLTVVPRVHILLGGSVVRPKELYEVNMERVALGHREKSLETLSCIRKLFHTLFVEDVLNELRSLPLMNMLLLVEGHRDSGIQWFRPKLNYRVPERCKKLVISLSCSPGSCSPTGEQTNHSDSSDYIWFQAPIIIKGFYA